MWQMTYLLTDPDTHCLSIKIKKPKVDKLIFMFSEQHLSILSYLDMT